MDEAPRFLTVDDYEPVARERLERGVYDYYAGGAGDEVTLRENVRAFERWVVRPRFLRGSGSPDPSTTVLGVPIAFPLLVAPWAYQWMAHEDGEEGTARAAGDAGTVMVVSSTAVDRLEGVAIAGSGPKWWQLYLAEDRGYSADMLARVVAAGYGAIVWTVDVPALGLRRRDARNGFVLPMGLTGGARSDFEPNLTWEDLAWIREHAPGLPVLVKGILTAEDARLAAEHGADAVVVSNHGGRQLDRAPAGIDALPEVVEAVGGSIPVLVDGGVRRGLDVLTALALGAVAALVARPIAWGLAAVGEAGVRDVLRILHDEFVHAMSLTGCRSVDEIGPGLVARAP
jgi:isopentenyl diphosphate isomerase/L-lactate dehydrogenase-like FMN-dependent dehydrogenase